jgi:hypothetical protein
VEGSSQFQREPAWDASKQGEYRSQFPLEDESRF